VNSWPKAWRDKSECYSRSSLTVGVPPFKFGDATSACPVILYNLRKQERERAEAHFAFPLVWVVKLRRALSHRKVRDAVSSHLGQRSIDAADLGTLALHEVDLVGCEAHGSRRMRRLGQCK